MLMWTSDALNASFSIAIALSLVACESNDSGTQKTSCKPAQKLCAADAGTPSCASLLTDNANCGACGKACAKGAVCADGLCIVTTCAAGLTRCSTDSGTDAGTDAGATPYCANLLIDNANCGCCSNVCSPSQTCQNGRCDATGSYGFFLFGDMHAGPVANNALARVAMGQMIAIDPNAVAAFSNGDLVNASVEAQWAQHDTIVAEAGFSLAEACPASFGANGRYFATVGDNEPSTATWFDLWNQHLPAQKTLGQNSEEGIYYSVAYANALFVMLDSGHVTPEATSWLESVLAAARAQLKFLFFHQPVYPCVSRYAPLSAALPWVDLAERYGVRVVFSSHTHAYTRSCPRKAGACTADGTGVVYVETGTISADPRQSDVTASSVTGTDAAGNVRTDSYNCQSDLMASGGSQNDFCHVRVQGCQASVDCYLVAAGNTVPYDTWTVNGCN